LVVESVIEMGSTIGPDDNSQRARAYLTFTHALWQAFTRTHHVISKARQKELRQYGMTVEEAAVLFTVLRLKGHATPAAISRQLFWELHSVSEQLTRMEAKGLVRKVRDLGRRNLIRAEVTEKGVEVYRTSSRRRSAREIMSVLDKEEQRQLWALLAKLREKALHELGAGGSDPLSPSDPDESR
jgi:DNA-binding MarR family transcriptional regulator